MQICRMRQHGHFVVEIRLVDEKREEEYLMNLALSLGKRNLAERLGTRELPNPVRAPLLEPRTRRK